MGRVEDARVEGGDHGLAHDDPAVGLLGAKDFQQGLAQFAAHADRLVAVFLTTITDVVGFSCLLGFGAWILLSAFAPPSTTRRMAPWTATGFVEFHAVHTSPGYEKYPRPAN